MTDNEKARTAELSRSYISSLCALEQLFIHPDLESGQAMSCWSKEQLEQMLEDVVNELSLSDAMIEQHGPMGTPPAELVRLVLQHKDKVIRNLRAGMVEAKP